jgi:tetratricopeptide (TPR) repeat protein
MTRSDFVERLRGLKRAVTEATARRLEKDLVEAAPRVDAELRDALRRELERRGRDVPPMSAAPLGIGETYLLLFEAPAVGHAVRLEVRRTVDKLDPHLAHEVRRAYRGAVATAAARCGQLDAQFPSVFIDGPSARFRIEGGSLGLAVAVGSFSEATGVAPAGDTVGSAQVTERGELRPVEHLPVKLDALRKRWPDVKRVVVAQGQKWPADYVAPIEVCAVATLREALPYFGIDIESPRSLKRGTKDSYRARLAAFEGANGMTTSWVNLALEARECAAALADEPDKVARAWLSAALFSLHAGDEDETRTLLANIHENELEAYPELQARKLVVMASSEIDRDLFDDSASHADAAERLCREDKATYREVFGQVLGTRGRALMHRGDYAAAEPLLHAAVEHHRAFKMHAEVPRSSCYLAACLRLSGQLDKANAVAREALAAIERLSADYDVAIMTGLFLRLELARIATSSGDWTEAVREFEIVRAAQVDAAAWPGLGGARGLARALREVGRGSESDLALAQCVSVASDAAQLPIFRKVAAVAAGEALLGIGGTSGIARGPLEEAWRSAFGSEPEKDVLERTIHAWMY